MSVREQPRLVEELHDAQPCPGCQRPVEGARCGYCGAASRAGRYRIARLIAHSAHSRVYEAIAPDGTRVALKELQFSAVPDAAAIDAFEREAATLAALKHPAIPRFIESFREGEGVGLRLYLASALIAGQSLAQRIAAGSCSEEELVDLARQTLSILDYLHRQTPTVLHRDLKPQNLLLDGGRVRLVDFGSTRRMEKERTHGSTLVGTFGYMAPEQLGGTVDRTTDLYGLGATLLHAATGTPPGELLQEDLTPRVPTSLSAPMRAFLTRLLQPRRERRYPTARDAEKGLRALLRQPARERWMSAALVLAIIAVVTATLLLSPRPPSATVAAPPAKRVITMPKPPVMEIPNAQQARALSTADLFEALNQISPPQFATQILGTPVGQPIWDEFRKRPDAMTMLMGIARNPMHPRWLAALQMLPMNGYEYVVAFPAADQLTIIDLVTSPEASDAAKAILLREEFQLTDGAWEGLRARLQDPAQPIARRRAIATQAPYWAGRAIREQQALLRATALSLVNSERDVEVLGQSARAVAELSHGPAQEAEARAAIIAALDRQTTAQGVLGLAVALKRLQPKAPELARLRAAADRTRATDPPWAERLDAVLAQPMVRDAQKPAAPRWTAADVTRFEALAAGVDPMKQIEGLSALLELKAGDANARKGLEARLVKLAQHPELYVFQYAVGVLASHSPLSRETMLALMPVYPRMQWRIPDFAEQLAALGADAAPALSALEYCTREVGNHDLKLKCQLAVESIQRAKAH